MKYMIHQLFALINFELFGCPLSDENKKPFSEADLESLYKLANKHDLAHVVSDALYKNHLLPENSDISSKLQQAQVIALYRYTKMEHERKQIYRILEGNQIPFVPLKGIIIRPFYPQAYFRTSCDLDILIHKEDLDRAVSTLKNELGYSVPEDAETFHDVSLFSPGGIHLELHFTIENDQPFIDRMLSKVWEYCSPVSEGSMEYRQSHEFFMFHQIAHMVSHFLNGGCGIRPLADLELLRRKLPYDEATVLKMCDQCDIKTFYLRVSDLCDVWFGCKEHQPLTLQMESFILTGGVYGNRDNTMMINRSRQKNRLGYLFFRIFMPYRLLKTQYRVLIKHKWLYPLVTLWRWFSLLSPAKRRRAAAELRKSQAVTNEDQTNMQIFLTKLGLS